MLLPKRVKHRKQHRGRRRGTAKGQYRRINAHRIVLDRMGKPEAATAAYQRARDAQKR